MILKSGVCAVCGHRQVISVDDEPITGVLDMHNYEKFKRINLTRCSNCGYCSENLSLEVPAGIKTLVASKEYKNALDYEFMGDEKTLPDMEYLEVNVNELEAYCMVCKEFGNDLMTARVLARIADLKYMLSQTYIETKYMKDDEEMFADYDKVIDSLYDQSQINNEECLNFLRGVKISDSLGKIFVAERLCFSRFYDRARLIIDKLGKKVSFSDDLSKYIENFLTEVEQR